MNIKKQNKTNDQKYNFAIKKVEKALSPYEKKLGKLGIPST